jgi:hypothetical protein
MDDTQRYSLLTAREAADFLRVSLSTLWRLERQGLLMPFRTPGGHRRYSLVMLQAALDRPRMALASSHRPRLAEPDKGRR